MQFDTAVDSSSWRVTLALLLRISSDTWSKISRDITLIQQCILWQACTTYGLRELSCGPWELSQMQNMLQKPDFDRNQNVVPEFFQTTVQRIIDFSGPRQIYVDQFCPSNFLSCAGLMYGFISNFLKFLFYFRLYP